MLLSRFDSTRLRPVPVCLSGARSCSESAVLVASCEQGAGPLARPWWHPWAQPRIEQPFAVLRTTDLAVARRACLWLDGSWQLQDAASGLARWAVRLQALWTDIAWWRPLQQGDAWDAGVADHPARLEGFRPRRATLIVIDQALDEAGLRALEAIRARSCDLQRAVRVVLVEPAGCQAMQPGQSSPRSRALVPGRT
jgi:hypothetical protein